MTLVIPVGHYQVSYIHLQPISGQTAVCTLGLFYDGADFDNNANGADAAWINNVLPNINTTYQLTEIRWAVQEGTIRTRTRSDQGGLNDTPASPQIAILCRKETLAPGRKNKGRLYLPGMAEQDVDGYGTVRTERQAAVNEGFTDYIDALALQDFRPVILHNDATTPTDIYAITAQPKVATQRRRLR